MIDKERQANAANRLEELSIAMKEAVRLLRKGQPDAKAYALVYILRRQLGYVVNSMGRVGLPNSRDCEWADLTIDEAIWGKR